MSISHVGTVIFCLCPSYRFVPVSPYLCTRCVVAFAHTPVRAHLGVGECECIRFSCSLTPRQAIPFISRYPFIHGPRLLSRALDGFPTIRFPRRPTPYLSIFFLVRFCHREYVPYPTSFSPPADSLLWLSFSLTLWPLLNSFDAVVSVSVVFKEL